MDDTRIFVSVLQEMKQLASYHYLIPSAAEAITPAGVERLLQQGRGVLLLAHERNRAMEYAALGLTDAAFSEVRDLRGFNTLLTAPDVTRLRDCWQHIVLLDGDLLPGEAAAIRERCPRAQLHALKANPAFAQLLQSLRLTKDQLREMYKAVRAGGTMNAAKLGESLQLTVPQVLAALTALDQAELVRFMPEPFALVMLPMQKRDPMEGLLMQYLQTVK